MTFLSVLLVIVATLIGSALALADSASLAEIVKAALTQGQEIVYNIKCPTGWQEKQFGACDPGSCQTYCAIQCGSVSTQSGYSSVAYSVGTCENEYCHCAASTDTTQIQGQPAPAPHKPNHKKKGKDID